MDADIKELVKLMLEEQANAARAIAMLAATIDTHAAAEAARIKRPG